jgi:hypothetical protein
MISTDIEMQPTEARWSVFNQLRKGPGYNIDVEEGGSADHQLSVHARAIGVEPSNESRTLFEFSATNSKFRHFLMFTGNWWPKSGAHYLARCTYFGTRAAILVCAVLLLLLVAYYIKIEYLLFPALLPIPFLVLYIMLFLGTISVLPAQYYNHKRLSQAAELEDFLAVDESSRIAATYGAFSAGCVVASVVLRAENDRPTTAACAMSLAVVIGLTFNMFFLLLDLKVSSLLLDQLHVLADKKVLTMEKFSIVRAEIHRRVVASRIACDFVIVPAVAAVVGIVMVVFILSTVQEGAYDDNFVRDWFDTGVQPLLGLAMVQLKELFFVAVAFVYVAKVNARADELTCKLSDGFWGQYESEGSAVKNGAFNPSEKIQISDLHRMSIHMSAVSRPISFTLLFKRVSWRDVTVGAVGLGATVMIGIIKNIVESTVI